VFPLGSPPRRLPYSLRPLHLVNQPVAIPTERFEVLHPVGGAIRPVPPVMDLQRTPAGIGRRSFWLFVLKVVSFGAALLLLLQPIPKFQKPRQRFPVLLTVRRLLAADDVVNAANGESANVNVSPPSILKPIDSIRRKDQVQIKCAILQLYENFSLANFFRFLIGQLETEFLKRLHEPFQPKSITINRRQVFHERKVPLDISNNVMA
jgi:hypothetical protein